MEQQNEIKELMRALLRLAHSHEVETGDISYLDQVRAYLRDSQAGQEILQEDNAGTLESSILS